MRLLEHVRAASAERFLELPTSPAETSSATATCLEPEQSGAEPAFVGKYQIKRRFSEASGQAPRSSFGEGMLPCVLFYLFPLKFSRSAHRLATGRKFCGRVRDRGQNGRRVSLPLEILRLQP